MRLHPYLSERILSHAAALAPLAALAGAHHERLDGSGYHRGSPAALLPPAARILAAADAYQAMTQDAAPPAGAAARGRGPATLGRGRQRPARRRRRALRPGRGRARAARPPPAWPAGLSEREVEVLRLIARGASYKEVAGRLSISPKTAEHHVAHIYAKIGVSSRAAAALFAMEHNLLAE